MDFDRHFPMTHRGHDYLFIVVDCFNKMCVLIPCKKTIFGQRQLDYSLDMSGYILDFQPPSYLTETMGSWEYYGKCFWERMDTKLKCSTTFHP
jgi:hypothetical protein